MNFFHPRVSLSPMVGCGSQWAGHLQELSLELSSSGCCSRWRPTITNYPMQPMNCPDSKTVRVPGSRGEVEEGGGRRGGDLDSSLDHREASVHIKATAATPSPISSSMAASLLPSAQLKGWDESQPAEQAAWKVFNQSLSLFLWCYETWHESSLGMNVAFTLKW